MLCSRAPFSCRAVSSSCCFRSSRVSRLSFSPWRAAVTSWRASSASRTFSFRLSCCRWIRSCSWRTPASLFRVITRVRMLSKACSCQAFSFSSPWRTVSVRVSFSAAALSRSFLARYWVSSSRSYSSVTRSRFSWFRANSSSRADRFLANWSIRFRLCWIRSSWTAFWLRYPAASFSRVRICSW